MSEHVGEFDLPEPLDSDGPDIADLLCQDIMARKEIGIKTYGKPLRANNGRPALWDLLAELLDACHYTRQKILEQEMIQTRLRTEAKKFWDHWETEGCKESLAHANGLRWAAALLRGEVK